MYVMKNTNAGVPLDAGSGLGMARFVVSSRLRLPRTIALRQPPAMLWNQQYLGGTFLQPPKRTIWLPDALFPHPTYASSTPECK